MTSTEYNLNRRRSVTPLRVDELKNRSHSRVKGALRNGRYGISGGIMDLQTIAADVASSEIEMPRMAG